MASVWRRLKVVVPGFGIGVALSIFCAAPWFAKHDPRHPATALLILFGPTAGPFAEPLAMVNYSLPRMCLWGSMLLLLIAVHPCWPCAKTGVLSGLATAFWFLLGFAYTYACAR